jgi:hypothetical protein
VTAVAATTYCYQWETRAGKSFGAGSISRRGEPIADEALVKVRRRLFRLSEGHYRKRKGIIFHIEKSKRCPSGDSYILGLGLFRLRN